METNQRIRQIIKSQTAPYPPQGVLWVHEVEGKQVKEVWKNGGWYPVKTISLEEIWDLLDSCYYPLGDEEGALPEILTALVEENAALKEQVIERTEITISVNPGNVVDISTADKNALREHYGKYGTLEGVIVHTSKQGDASSEGGVSQIVWWRVTNGILDQACVLLYKEGSVIHQLIDY